MSRFLTHVITTLTEGLAEIQAILLYGSQQNLESVDMWSDYDLRIVLKPEAVIDETGFVEAIHTVGVVVGAELYPGTDSVLYRAAIEFESSIRLLDAMVAAYKEWESTQLRDHFVIVFGDLGSSATSSTPLVPNTRFGLDDTPFNPTWFKYFAAIKKFCRHDNLVGIHLLLDLIREYLVLEMVERDNREKTNIHRYGGDERLPEPINLSHIDESDTKRVLDYIGQLALLYDQKLVFMVEGYTSRLHGVLAYIAQSKAKLTQ